MAVQSDQIEPRAAQTGDGLQRLIVGQTKPRLLLAGHHRAVGVDSDIGDDSQEDLLSFGSQPLKAVDVVEVVDDHRAHSALGGPVDLGIRLRVAMQVDPRRIKLPGQCHLQLA